MYRLSPLILSLTTAFAVSTPRARIEARPDFTGTWTLDASKSEAPMLPSSMQVKVNQTDKSLSIERTAPGPSGPQTFTLVYTLDGSVSKNTLAGGNGMSLETASTAEWNDEVLVVKTTATSIQNGFSQTERYSLSADKKVMTVNGDLTIGQQHATSKLIFTKQ